MLLPKGTNEYVQIVSGITAIFVCCSVGTH